MIEYVGKYRFVVCRVEDEMFEMESVFCIRECFFCCYWCSFLVKKECLFKCIDYWSFCVETIIKRFRPDEKRISLSLREVSGGSGSDADVDLDAEDGVTEDEE
mgnify:CR=1 FL=1